MREPDFERAIARDKDIYSQIELFLSDQKRLIYVPTDNIGLRITLRLERELASVSPLLNLLQLVHKENTCALSSSCWLHDPSCIRVLLEFLNEYGVIAREDVSHGHYVHVEQVAIFIPVSDGILLFFHVLPKSLDVFHHQVLPGELGVIWEVVENPKL